MLRPPAAEPERGRAAACPALRLAWFQATIAWLGFGYLGQPRRARGERGEEPTGRKRRNEGRGEAAGVKERRWLVLFSLLKNGETHGTYRLGQKEIWCDSNLFPIPIGIEYEIRVQNL